MEQAPSICGVAARPALALVATVVCIWLGLASCPPAWSVGGSVSTLAGSAGVSGDADGMGGTARFAGPYALACSADGTVYVADTDNGIVRKVAQDGRVGTLVGVSGGLQYPQGIACDAAGAVYVADTYRHVICRVLEDGSLTTVAGEAGEQGADDGPAAEARFSYPAGLACDAAGNVYVADSGNGTVRKVTPAGRVTTVIGPEAGLDSPQSVACAPDGSVYVTDTAGCRLIVLRASGGVAELAGPPELRYPGGVSCDSSGTVYVADTDNDCIRRYTSDGTAMVIAGAIDEPGSRDGAGPDARFDAPQGVACDASGVVYVADTGNSTVRRLAVDGRPPVTSPDPALADGPAAGWRKAGLTLTLTAVDTGAGVAATFCALDGAGFSPYTIPLVIAAPGSHLVRYYSVDAAGNEEAPRAGYVNIDLAPPLTTVQPPFASDPSGGWITTEATVTLSASDDLSGVAATRFSVDGGPATTYTAPFAVAGGGSHVVLYSSVDAAGNAETTRTAYVNIDAGPPVTQARPPLAGSPVTGWRNRPVTVTLEAKDDGSGVAGTTYAVDGAAAQEYTAPFTVAAAGSHIVAWSSVDVCGAVEETRTGYVNIDLSAPRTTASPAAVRAGATVTLRFRIDDAEPTCGTAAATLQVRSKGRTVRSVDLGTVVMNAGSTCRIKVRLPKGAYTWRVTATDAAGNDAASVRSAKLTVR